ncbi:MAG: iron ABC transporter [Thermoplasmata archaeon]|nr:MAG: iron ABC transporter [Thermoplasmata archaeon]
MKAYYKKRWLLIIAYLSIALLFSIFLALMIGVMGPIGKGIPDMEKITAKEIFEILLGKGNWPATHKSIILEIRLPRIFLAGIVGAALATAGCAMQGLFRNPMASPYILGISSGAAFGASLVIVSGLGIFGIYTMQISAFLFALIDVFVVYNIAKYKGVTPIETLLLAGIAVGCFFSALVSFMKYISGEELRLIVFWLMGGLWGSSWYKVYITFPLVILGICVLLLFSRELNIMLTGETSAMHLGVDVEATKKIILLFATLVTAAVVSVSGIIGFVGLIIPHIMRIVVGPDHRILLPSSCLTGAIFLIFADTLTRSIIQPAEMPVGIITALFGVPFFIYLLRRKRKVKWW